MILGLHEPYQAVHEWEKGCSNSESGVTCQVSVNYVGGCLYHGTGWGMSWKNRYGKVMEIEIKFVDT